MQAVASFNEIAPAIPGLASLAIIAGCVQGAFRIETNPGHTEPLAFWGCTIGEASTRKGAALESLAKPGREWEQGMHAQGKRKARKEQVRSEALIARIAKEKRRCETLDGAEMEAALEEIVSMQEQLPSEKPPPRIYADDVTPEKLARLLHVHQERITLVSTEGGTFAQICGRYNRGVPNTEVYVKGWSGESVTVDRRGEIEPIMLHAPTLSIGICIQPEVLRGLQHAQFLRNSGVLARFVYAYPASNLGHRKHCNVPIPDSLKDSYRVLVQRLLEIGGYGKPRVDPQTIPLTPAAFEVWCAYVGEIERELRAGGRFEQCKDWAGKLAGNTARIAGLLCLAKAAGNNTPWASVKLEEMASAVAIAKAAESHALKVFDLLHMDLAMESARKVQRWIETSGHKMFSRSEVMRGCRGIHGKQMTGALGVLEEALYIRPMEAPQSGPSGGRPASLYEVNPRLLEAPDGR